VSPALAREWCGTRGPRTDRLFSTPTLSPFKCEVDIRLMRHLLVVHNVNYAVKAYRDRWVTPHDKDPLTVSMAEKIDLLNRVTTEVKTNAKVFSGSASLNLRGEDKYFASSEGSSIQQYLLQSYGNLDATAVDRENNISRSRSYVPTQAAAGWEYVPEMNLEENARRIREEVVEH